VRILFLDSSSQLGGAERVLLDLLAGLRAERPDWALTLCAPGDGPLVPRARALGVTVVVAPFPRGLRSAGDYALRWTGLVAAAPGAATYAWKVRRLIRAVNPDIIHSNGFKMHLAAAWLKTPRSRLVWHLHDYVSRRSRSAALLRRSAHRCAAIVANSRSVADDARAVLESAIVPVPILNGVDLDRFSPAGSVADLDAMAGLPPAPDGTLRVGLVATYAAWKGHFTFLAAIARLPVDLRVRAYIVGGPIYETTGSQHTREALEAEADRLGVRDRVAFINFVDEPASVYRALDVVVHASTEPEPFGLVVAEAMACGRAVVASDAGGVREIVEPAVTGLTHAPGDDAGLSAALVTLAADAALRRRLGAAARAAAEGQWGKDRMVLGFCRHYEDLARSPAAVDVRAGRA
jgi:glycosyltransferase involved in cell wall biosynthesis